ncbi:MAG: glycosyltransferase [Alphaproteobacteria bacterium]|nr:glycosyltransferase [Alphaproteobacteria bacterium]
MRIVHVVTRLLRAGSEENTVSTCLWQAQSGHTVTLIHGRDYDLSWYSEIADKIDLVCVHELVHPIAPLSDIRAVFGLKKVLDDVEPDVVHTHQSKAGIVGRLAARTKPGVIVIHGVHVLSFDGVSALKKAFYVKAEKLAARMTDAFVTVSPHVADRYLELGISQPENTFVVYSGMDLRRFQSAVRPHDAESLVGAASPENPPRVALMLAALEPRKQHLKFLEEVARQRHRFAGVRILLAGDGPRRDQIVAKIEDERLEQIVQFCGYRTDPEALIALADIGVLFSKREGLPRVIIQFIAGGRPVVVSALPGIDEIAIDSVNAAIIDQDDISIGVTELAEILADNERLESLKKGAERTDVSRWSLEALGARTTEVYVEIMQRKKASMGHLSVSDQA